MAIVLAGIVAPARTPPSARAGPIRLDHGFELHPCARRLIDEQDLDPATHARATTLSRGSRAVYIEAEFFGGTGAQCAIGYEDGGIVLGPLRTQSDTEEWSEGFVRIPPGGEGWAINRALRWLGVPAGAHHDEFESLGLAALPRCLEDWS